MLTEKYRPGAIIAYIVHPNNAPHHSGAIGKLISYALSFEPDLDHTITHVGLVDHFSNASSLPGFTELNVIDTLDGHTVDRRPLERAFAFEVYSLIPGLILQQDNPCITSEQLSAKALAVAQGLIGIRYNRWKLLDVIRFHYHQEPESVDANYTNHLINRFKINFKEGSFSCDKQNETLICPELVISSYQIAWLLLAGESAATKPMPPFININPRISTAGLINFIRHNPCFEPVDAISNHAIRYSGTRHPNDTDNSATEVIPLGYATVRFSANDYIQGTIPSSVETKELKIK